MEQIFSTAQKEPEVAVVSKSDEPSIYLNDNVSPNSVISKSDEPSKYLNNIVSSTPDNAAHKSVVSNDGSWNSKFQSVIEATRGITASTPYEDKIAMYTELSDLAFDFNDTAKNYAKIIISEKHLPIEKKSIKPTDIGGLAGGMKYAVNDIMFKFAVESHLKLGEDGDEKAAKIAGADLTGLIAYHSCEASDICFPMTALVDFCGFRVIAMSKLPISKALHQETLIYGSQDGGKTIEYKADEHFITKMKEICSKLNLKPHKCSGSEHTLYSAADVEGHKGTDGRYYLCDFSRTMPPEKPKEGVIGSVLMYRLRPEFVKKYSQLLNPDAYSDFIHSKDENEDNKIIDDATTYLHSTVIPQFASELQQWSAMEYDTLCVELHKHGINYRHLGKVRNHLHDEKRVVVLFEMICRALKNTIRGDLRAKREEMRLPGVQPYKSIIINYFNTLFRDDQQSRDFWCCGIKDILKKKYGEGLSATEEEQSYHLLMSLRQIEDANCMLFVRLSVMLGLEWREPERFLSDDSALNAADFDISDLGDIEPTVKQLNIAAMAQGYVLKTKLDGKKIRTSRIEEDLNKGSILSPEALDWAKDQFDQLSLQLQNKALESLTLTSHSIPLEIPTEDIEVGEFIGEGVYSDVYKGYCYGTPVAIKKFKYQGFDGNTLKEVRKAVRIMNSQPNLLMFLGACTRPGHLMIVTELMPRSFRDLSEMKVALLSKLKMAKEAAKGISWLHSLSPAIVHRDLKPENILIDQSGNGVKVADFGLSAVKDHISQETEEMKKIRGSPAFMSPEDLLGEELSPKSDVYSFGMILWELVTDQFPYEDLQIESFEQLIEEICVKKTREKVPETCSQSLKLLIEACWQSSPKLRPNFLQIIKQLDICILEVAIEDKEGRALWSKHFSPNNYLKTQVSWKDFVQILALHMNMNVHLKNFQLLKAILVKEGDVVTIEEFGNILKWMGPLDSTEQDNNFLTRMHNLFTKRWFHGDISLETAETRLEGTAPGTFLIRFSSSPGNYALSMMIMTKNNEEAIVHCRITHKAGGTYAFTLDDIVYEFQSLEELIKSPIWHLGMACGGSKYYALTRIRQMHTGYINTNTKQQP